MIASKIKLAVNKIRYKNTEANFVYGMSGSQNIQMDASSTWSVNIFDVRDSFPYDQMNNRTFQVRMAIYAVSEFAREPDYYDTIISELYEVQKQMMLNLDDLKATNGFRELAVVGNVVTIQQQQVPLFDVPVTGIEFTFSCQLQNYNSMCITVVNDV